MEKHLGWAHKLGGVESLGISRAGQTVLARLMESQIWHQLSGSVGGGFRKDNGLCSPDARHYSLSSYATGALQIATPVLELGGSKSE